MSLPDTSRHHQRKVRVLIVTDEMEVGGTQRQIVHIARGLDRERFEATVVYFCNRSFLADELERAGVNVVEIRKEHRIDFHFIWKLVKFIDNGRFDVMHCFSFTGELWGAVARRLIRPSRRPVLITSVRNKYDWYSRFQWRIKRWTASQSSRVIANSRSGAEHAAAQIGLEKGSIDVVYNGVGEPSTAAIAQRAPSRPIIMALFVGRLVEQKNVPVLLRAMKTLHEKEIPVHLRIAGDGPLRKHCDQLINEYGLERAVELLGERPDVAMLMATSDFVVLPSYREGLSNVILEAMMVGRPVVASNVGGNAELVEAMRTGLLFENDNDTELAQAMLALVMNSGMREAFGAQGRQRATEHFTVRAMVTSMERFYSLSAITSPSPQKTRLGAA